MQDYANLLARAEVLPVVFLTRRVWLCERQPVLFKVEVTGSGRHRQTERRERRRALVGARRPSLSCGCVLQLQLVVLAEIGHWRLLCILHAAPPGTCGIRDVITSSSDCRACGTFHIVGTPEEASVCARGLDRHGENSVQRKLQLFTQC